MSSSVSRYGFPRRLSDSGPLEKPQKRHFWVQGTDNSQAAISVTWSRDLFVAMGNSLGDGAWSMRIQYKPLVRYIWLGALVMAIGGLLLLVLGFYAGYRLHLSPTLADRVRMWQSPWDNAAPGGDQVAHAVWGMATGGWFGTGLGLGDLRYLPAGHTVRPRM